MELFLQQIFGGVATGSIYAALALALVMIFQAIGHINFAQGEMAMLSAFVAWQMIEWGVPYWLSFAATVALSFAGGMVIHGVVVRPLAHAPALSQIVAFIALFAIINSVAGFTWDYTVRPFPSPFGTGPFLGSPMMSRHQAGALAVVAALLVVLRTVLHRTRLGIAMRAAAQDPVTAGLNGIDVDRMAAVGWGMAAAAGAVAGMLIAPTVFLEPNMMQGVLLYAFAGAVLGGLASPLGAVLGGLLLGVIENLAATYVPVVGSELKLPLALAVIVAVLVLRASAVRPIARQV